MHADGSIQSVHSSLCANVTVMHAPPHAIQHKWPTKLGAKTKQTYLTSASQQVFYIWGALQGTQ